jgi:TPR repeat protein
MLGQMYANGIGVTQSDERALNFYKQGCDLGNDRSCKAAKDLSGRKQAEAQHQIDEAQRRAAEAERQAAESSASLPRHRRNNNAEPRLRPRSTHAPHSARRASTHGAPSSAGT